MFGFSLTKLVFTILAVVVVWHGFKWVARMQEKRDLEAKEKQRAGVNKAKPDKAAIQGVEDMVKCKVCESFIAAKNASSCGRDDCPYIG